jgi:hypothetical protein
MKTIFTILLLSSLLVADNIYAQSNFEDCSSFTASYTTTESRCASTGSVTVTASGGSGNYTYKVTGPVSTPVTSSPVISALSPGSYTLTVKDINTGCVLIINNVTITGTYIDPRFGLSNTDVSCSGGSNASITVINQTNGRNPFTYKIIDPSPSNVGTSNSTGIFTNLSAGEYFIQQRDSCGGVQTRSIVINGYNWWVNNNTVTKINCTTVSATIDLTDNSGNTNNSGSDFNGFYYGVVNSAGDTAWVTTKTFNVTRSPLRTITFVIKDRCGLVKSFNWSNPVPSFSSFISSSNHSCNTFTATAQGFSNLTNPQFCLKQGTTTIACNSTGVFDNVPYGSYCMEMTDACYDTTITYCFTKSRRKPAVNSDVTISDNTCTTFTASITGQSYLFNPQYCIYDNSNNLINCNTTGVFTNLPYNNYCIQITSAAPCYDTVITRCFSAIQQNPSAGDPSITNRTCSSFDVSIPYVSYINSPNYCLYDSLGNLINCNTTGSFTNIPYGGYCIIITDLNPGTGCNVGPVSKCFSVAKRTPSISSTVNITDKQCGTFTASVSRPRNLINPQYCLYDNNSNLISCNTTGSFTNINYGSYCIKITHSCNDTTITRCFSALPDPLVFSAAASQSCTIGKTDITVTPSSGQSPYTAKILNPGNAVVATGSFSSSSYTFTGIASMPAGNQYKIVLTDNCGRTDTTMVTPAANQFDRAISVTGKCPTAQNQNGSADLNILLTSNMGFYDPVIIKKNGTAATINYSSTNTESANTQKYIFNDLAPATYIISYLITSCSKYIYDTVTVSPYNYPTLQNSAVYQCDNNGFSVNAVATGGAAPYSYEIIGSNPSAPGITTAPQSSPIFNINTGTSYSLVRLRVIDGCGNGSLNDVGVLPLMNISIIANTFDCFYNNITLSTDTIPNATYTWYKKAKTTSTDSTIIGSALSYNLPYLLPTDTGVYIVKASVNTGCLTRLAYFNINGNCGGSIGVLPVKLVNFTGKPNNKKTELDFSVTNEAGLKEYTIQRKNISTGKYEDLGTIKAINAQIEHSYSFTDYNPYLGVNEYRLLLLGTNGKAELSKTVQVTFSDNSVISAMPNPVSDALNIQFRNSIEASYEVALFNANGQRIYFERTGKIRTKTIQIKRTVSMISGVYFLKIFNTTDGTTHNEKLIFNR